MRVVAGLFALMLATPAAAVTGLQWQWDGPRQYLLSAEVDLPEQFWLLAERNLEARITEAHMQVLTTCEPVAQTKSATRLKCTIDQFQLRALPTASTRKALPAILGEFDEGISGGFVQLELGLDGVVRSVDHEGLPKNNVRQKEIHEASRLLLQRAFASFNLQLPKKGDDKGKGAFRQTKALELQLPSAAGSIGRAVIDHAVSGDGAAVAIATKGRGTMSSGETIIVGDQERPKNMFDLTIEGDAVFDTTGGALVSRTYTVEGLPTPSSALAEAGHAAAYRQRVSLRLIAPGEAVEPLGPSKPLFPKPAEE